MLESLFYPGDCYIYGASTLTTCHNDWVPGGWWTTTASGSHLELSAFDSGGQYCFAVSDVPSVDFGAECKTPAVDWQRWDIP